MLPTLIIIKKLIRNINVEIVLLGLGQFASKKKFSNLLRRHKNRSKIYHQMAQHFYAGNSLVLLLLLQFLSRTIKTHTTKCLLLFPCQHYKNKRTLNGKSIAIIISYRFGNLFKILNAYV